MTNGPTDWGVSVSRGKKLISQERKNGFPEIKKWISREKMDFPRRKNDILREKKWILRERKNGFPKRK